MASKAQQALSANLAALSYALELTQQAPGFNVDITGPRRGVRDMRRSDAERASPADMGVEFEPGKPLKNFGRLLAHQAGIPLPYNFRQARESAQAYEEQQLDEQQLAASTFLQISDDTLRLESFGNAALDEQAANLRRDATEASWQYENFRDPDMRAAALTRLQGLQAEANKALDTHVNAGLQEARTFAREELKDLRRSINEVQDAYSSRRGNADAMRARLALIGTGEIDEKSIEGQAILAEAFERMAQYQDAVGSFVSGAGQAIGFVPNPYAAAAGAAVSVIGNALTNENKKLNYSDVIKAFEAQQTALDKFTNGDGEAPGFIPQLLERLSSREQYARDKLGIPIDESWRATQFEFPEAMALPKEQGEEEDYSTARRYEQLAERARRRQTR